MKFQDFKKKYLSSTLNKIGNIFRPENMNRTCQITWQSMSRLPTVISEPIFTNMFDTHEFVESISLEPVSVKAAKLRNSAVTYLSNKRILNLNPVIVNKVFKVMDNNFKLDSLRFTPIYPQEASDLLPTSTSSGFPDFITPKSLNAPKVISQTIKMLMNLDFSAFEEYLVPVSWRTQVRKSGVKFRQFFVFPHLIQLTEMMFAAPFFKHFEVNKDSVYCFGNKFPELSERWKSWQNYKYIYSIDMSNFDLSVQLVLINLAFRWLKSHVRMPNDAYAQLWEKIVDYHNHCKVATAYNGVPIILSKSAGIMSGSVFTNFLDTIVNAFCTYYFLLDHGIDPNVPLAIMGDDIILPLNTEFSLDYISKYYLENFGLEVSKEKTIVFAPGDRVYFLGHYFDPFGRYIDEELTKKQLSISERFIPEEEMSTAERLVSKIASICFKCVDGKFFFDKYIDEVLKETGLSGLPQFYVELFTISGEDLNVRRRVLDYYQSGWMLQ